MASSIVLTPEELIDVTGFKRQSHQLRALRRLGIPAATNHDGPHKRVIVLRADVENPRNERRPIAEYTPNFDAA